MNPKDGEKFPFVTRKMLAFEEGVPFSLQINSTGPVGGTLVIRGITKEGIFTFNHLVGVDTSVASRTFRIPDVPIFISVADKSGNISQGMVYTSLNLLANGQNIYNFFSGFVYAQKQLSWPISNVLDQRPNGGLITYTESSNPAAGVEISQTLPSTDSWEIKTMVFTLVTSATVANRRVHILFQIDGLDVFEVFCDIDQPASTTYKYVFANFGDVPDRLDNNVVLVSIPQNLIMTQGQIISTVTTNLQIGDNFSTMVTYYEKFFSQ